MPAPPTSVLSDPLAIIKRLTDIGLALSAENDLDRLLEIILVEAKEISGADGGTLYYRTEDEKLDFAIIRNDTLKIAYGGSTGKKAPIPPIHLHDPATGKPNLATQSVFAVLIKKPINIPDVYSANGFDFEGTKSFDKTYNYRTTSVLTIPMISHSRDVSGCLQLVNAKDPATGKIIPFSEEVEHLVQSLTSQAAVILDNKKLILAQRNLLESFIKLIAEAIDAKSPYTGTHCARVPVLTNMLAQAACDARDGMFKDFKLTDEEKYELHIAGWLHDCGKITTPVHVMDKSTKLETIFDRIEMVRTRFELFRRDARIVMLEQMQQPGADRAALEAAYKERLRHIDEDIAFIIKTNIGGESMSEEDLARLKKIAASYTWKEENKDKAALTDNELYNLSVRKGTLTTEERKVMNDHMVYTCQMLEALPFPKHLRRVPEYAGGHHERMDGKGYPKGIKAGTMSVPARMMAIADVFEALTAPDRPYKAAKKLSETMSIIGNLKKQNHLDPDIVDFFVTSKTYLEYARKYLEPNLIDTVDEAAFLAIRPLPMT
jgi:HD-GYP domain-containing protein (c-di-GMP phosphodiesterase class II)